jgi:molecular chaperone DnaJ
VSTKDYLEKDYYKVLGVSKDASTDEIKKSFRKLARELHPDHNPGDEAALQRFKEVTEAYSVLSDKDKRKEYDEARSLFGPGMFRRGAGGAGAPGGGSGPFDLSDLLGNARQAGGGFSDLFGSLFGGGGGGQRRQSTLRGRDIEAEVSISFADAVRGTTLPLSLRTPGLCETCHGSGAKPGTTPRTCPHCGGRGLVSSNQGAFSFSEPCPECQGVGTIVDEKCPECHGNGSVTKVRTLNVRLPAGVDDGQRIRIRGKGEPSPNARAGTPGDLYVVVHVKGDKLFARQGDDLTLSVPVTFAEAAAGTELRLPTLDGTVTLRVPPGTPSGRKLRVRGKGVPHARGTGAGDLLVTVEIQVPTGLSEDARKALAEFSAATAPAPRDAIDAEVRRREHPGGA